MREPKGAPHIAQKVEVHLEDDLDGGSAAETLSFALDGKEYAIAPHAEELREVLRPYATAGRKATRIPGTRTSGSDPETAKIRTWAKANGHAASDRDRIHQHIRDVYYAAG